jgi:hypothetical protein
VLAIEVKGRRVRASIDGQLVFDVEDTATDALMGGGVALLVDTGSIATDSVQISSL